MKKVRSGEPLRIPAQTFNSFVDAARLAQSQIHSVAARPVRRDTKTGIITIRNTTEKDVGRFGILVLDTVTISPEDNELAFQNTIAFDCVAPGEKEGKDKLVILQEPIRKGRMGKALIQGLSPVKIDVKSEDDSFGVPPDGYTTHLESASEGAAGILFKEDGLGEKWAVVQLGGGGGAGKMTFSFYNGGDVPVHKNEPISPVPPESAGGEYGYITVEDAQYLELGPTHQDAQLIVYICKSEIVEPGETGTCFFPVEPFIAPINQLGDPGTCYGLHEPSYQNVFTKGGIGFRLLSSFAEYDEEGAFLGYRGWLLRDTSPTLMYANYQWDYGLQKYISQFRAVNADGQYLYTPALQGHSIDTYPEDIPDQ